jgi:hypothetical protein
MYYVLMIHADESGRGPRPPEGMGNVAEAVERFDNDLSEAGQNVGSIRLQPSATATTIRVRGGKVLTSDGPFAENKEQLGGLYLIEAGDLDEARNVAARLPTATFCTVEVRPVASIDLRRAVQGW